MKANDIPQMLVSSPASIFYLTGKWISPGERMITLYLNTKGEQKFIVNELFPINEDLGVDILWYNDTMNPIDILDKIIDHEEVLGIDKDWKAHFLIQLLDRNSAKKFVNGSPIVDRVRMRKDDEEIALMKEASRINDIVVENDLRPIASDFESTGIGNKNIIGRYLLLCKKKPFIEQRENTYIVKLPIINNT